MKKIGLISGWFIKSDRMANVVLIIAMACAVLSSYSFCVTQAYAEPLKIAVLPFEINAEQNFDFLKSGIQAMLNSRLSFKDEVRVIDKEVVQKVAGGIKGFTGESFALLVGGQLKADFVISGSVTVIGNSTSIDSKLIDITGKKPPIAFFRQSEDPSGVIPAINQFATTINETLFNRSSGVATTSQQSVLSTPQGDATTSIAGASASQPETAVPGQQQLNSNFALNNQSRSQLNGQIQSPNPEFAVTNNVRGQSGFWKSPKFKHLINGISLGDTDKDNLMETIFISDHALYIYRFSNGRFVKTAEPVKSRLSTYIGVDAGDINGNGVEEIFVTTLNPEKNMPNSFVLEYDGSKYVSIVKNTPWYFQISETKGGEKILLGQKQKSNKADIYTSPIYKMRWDGENYVPTEKILDSNKANVLGVMFDDITGDKSTTIMAYDKSEHLTLFSQSGDLLWRDLNSSGGNLNYFQLPKESPTDDHTLQYFPLPARSADINQDGTVEVLYASNSDIASGYLSKFKRYNKGVIHCAFWNSSGLSLQWSTPEQPGRVSDFLIGDFDNDGVKELIISNVIKDALSSFSESESLVTVYELMQ